MGIGGPPAELKIAVYLIYKYMNKYTLNLFSLTSPFYVNCVYSVFLSSAICRNSTPHRSRCTISRSSRVEATRTQH